MPHGWAVLSGIASVLLVLLSANGFGDVGAEAAHHYAHIALPTLAFLIFSGGVVRDVRRNGWPAFSWQL